MIRPEQLRFPPGVISCPHCAGEGGWSEAWTVQGDVLGHEWVECNVCCGDGVLTHEQAHRAGFKTEEPES